MILNEVRKTYIPTDLLVYLMDMKRFLKIKLTEVNMCLLIWYLQGSVDVLVTNDFDPKKEFTVDSMFLLLC